MRQTGAAFLYSSFPAYCSSHARTVHYQEFQSQRAASMLAERVSDSLTHREKKKSVISRRRGLLVSACASGACSTNACACVCSLFTCYTCTNCVSMLIFVKRSKWESFVRSFTALSRSRSSTGSGSRSSDIAALHASRGRSWSRRRGVGRRCAVRAAARQPRPAVCGRVRGGGRS